MISGELRHEGRARACILYIDPPPASCSCAWGKPGCQAWTYGPHRLRVLPALAEPPQLCIPFPWERELPGLSHLPQFTLCSPSPQGSEFVPQCGSWAEDGARGQPLCVLQRRGLCPGLTGEGRVLLGSCSLSQMPMPCRLPPSLPSQGKAGGAASSSP